MRHNGRVIPLDELQVGKLVDDLLDELMSVMEDDARFTKRTAMFEDVRGKPKRVKVGFLRVARRGIFRQVIHGAKYTPETESITIDVHLPTLKHRFQELEKETGDWQRAREATYAATRPELRRALVHELTHVRDLIERQDIRQTRVPGLRMVAPSYVNSPHEVRAYGREIAETVADAVRQGKIDRLLLTGQELERLVRRLGRPFHFHLMNDDNQRRVLGMVTRYLSDVGLVGE